MATTKTFLQYTNWVLNDLNEVELTAQNFSASTGIQLVAKNSVNRAIRDIVGGELEWPFNYATYSQALLPGVQLYALQAFRSIDWDSFKIQPIEELTNGTFTSTVTSWTDISAGSGSAAFNAANNGSARLTGDGTDIGGLTQSITTVANRNYTLQVRHVSNAVVVKIGTTSGGTQISTTTVALDNAGEGEIQDISFTATGATTYISITNTSTTAVDIDYIKVKENRRAQHLSLMSFDEWRRVREGHDVTLSASMMAYPDVVFRTQNDEFGVSRVPLQANWEVVYDYWTAATDMSGATTTTLIDDRWGWLIVEGAKQYVLATHSDPAFAKLAKANFDQGLQRMRIENINKEDVMNAHTNPAATRSGPRRGVR